MTNMMGIDQQPGGRAAWRRLPSWGWAAVGVAAVLVLLAAGATGWALLGTGSTTAANAPSPSAPPATSEGTGLQPFTEEEACLLVLPALVRATDVAGTVRGEDASAVDLDELTSVVKSLSRYVDQVPPSMRDDVHTQIRTLRQIEHMKAGNSYRLEWSEFSASGVALATRCRPYAADR